MPAEAGLDGGHVGEGVGEGDAGLHAADDGEPGFVAALRVGRVGRAGRPQVNVAAGKVEGRRHDADDGPGRRADVELFGEDGGIAIEAALPEAVADEERVRSAEVLFFGGEVAAEERSDLEHLKKARSDKSAGDFFGKGAGGFGEVVGVVATDGGEGGIHPVPLFEADGSDEAVGVAIADVVLVEANEAIAVGVGERAEDDGVDGGEDGAVGADAEGEGEDDGGGEGGRAAEKAEGRTQIEAQGFEEGRGVDFAELLADLLAAAEFEEGAAACFLRGEALGDAGLGELVDVVGDLAVEFGIAGSAAAEGVPGHLCLLARGAQDEFDCFREAVPGGLFGGELAAALGGELVELCLAAVFRVAPFGGEPAAFFETM